MSPELADVLLVEDDPDDASLTLRAMRRADVTLRIVHVHDGVSALEYLADTTAVEGARRPRIVLLDLALPRIGGLEVLRRIRAHGALRMLPVVVLTSSREPRDVAACYDRGANSYVVKPTGYAELIGTLGELTRYWLTISVAPP
ncbi:MAG: response regulator [Burkholderiales bacterium]|nr:response regulator [Burkholderiales bacterium]MCE7876474.1 response regulator [Betaproteobacteria bacterium PRO3]